MKKHYTVSNRKLQNCPLKEDMAGKGAFLFFRQNFSLNTFLSILPHTLDAMVISQV